MDLRIPGMDPFEYCEYAEQICKYTENTWNAQKVEYLSEFKTKNENVLGRYKPPPPQMVRLAKPL
jgi:hypothetical protein